MALLLRASVDSRGLIMSIEPIWYWRVARQYYKKKLLIALDNWFEGPELSEIPMGVFFFPYQKY